MRFEPGRADSRHRDRDGRPRNAGSTPAVQIPWRRLIPFGRRVELGGRGQLFVREVAGPPGAPTVVLLHGWGASGGLNWFQTFGELSRYFRVLAPDLRGHARGIRSQGAFRLADCADDVAAFLTLDGAAPVIAVGYSMGGAVGQLLWLRHRPLLAGLVLCATAPSFPQVPSSLPAFAFLTAAAGTSRLGGYLTRPVAAGARYLPRPGGDHTTGFRQWALGELRRHDTRMLFEAGRALLRYNAWPWISSIDIPTAIVTTTKDHAVAPHAQARMAARIPNATFHPLDDGHLACARPHFAPPLLAACRDVAQRVSRHS